MSIAGTWAFAIVADWHIGDTRSGACGGLLGLRVLVGSRCSGDGEIISGETGTPRRAVDVELECCGAPAA